MARRQIPRGIQRRHTAVKIKIAYQGEWMAREACLKALLAIGFSVHEAELYLDRPTPHVVVIRA